MAESETGNTPTASFREVTIVGAATRVGWVVGMGAWLAACATATPTGSPVLSIDTDIVMHDHPLTLHLSLTPQHVTTPLILYATGDGGWWGRDKDIFDELVRWGYPVAGFSARDYVHHLGDGVSALPVDEVAADFARVVHAAAAALGLPEDTRVVLVGMSRGAGLDVAVAGQALVRSQLQGVIAIALTREEEYVEARGADGAATMLLTYPALAPIGNVPVAVIQSTHDDYVPAAEARGLFGPETASRTLRPIESTNHSFDGGVADLYRAMTDCFNWIVNQ